MLSNASREKIHSFRGWRAEVGLLVPVPWMCREWEVAAPEGIRFSKAVMEHEAHTSEALRALAHDAEKEAKKLNQGQRCDLICFCCTSGSFIGGQGYDQMIIEKIEKASDSPGTTTTTCVLEVLKDTNVKKMAIVGPYPESTLNEEINFLNNNGYEILYSRGLGYEKLTDYYEFGMDPFSSYKLVKDGAKSAPKADCIFLTCGTSPLLGIADFLESEIGKPVISSSSATLYGILKKLGIRDPIYNYGEVLRRERCI